MRRHRLESCESSPLRVHGSVFVCVCARLCACVPLLFVVVAVVFVGVGLRGGGGLPLLVSRAYDFG